MRNGDHGDHRSHFRAAKPCVTTQRCTSRAQAAGESPATPYLWQGFYPLPGKDTKNSWKGSQQHKTHTKAAQKTLQEINWNVKSQCPQLNASSSSTFHQEKKGKGRCLSKGTLSNYLLQLCLLGFLIIIIFLLNGEGKECFDLSSSIRRHARNYHLLSNFFPKSKRISEETSSPTSVMQTSIFMTQRWIKGIQRTSLPLKNAVFLPIWLPYLRIRAVKYRMGRKMPGPPWWGASGDAPGAVTAAGTREVQSPFLGMLNFYMHFT